LHHAYEEVDAFVCGEIVAKIDEVDIYLELDNQDLEFADLMSFRPVPCLSQGNNSHSTKFQE
jgi:hypothetical protein